MPNQGINLYCYCMNDPISWYDPDGNWTFSISLSLNLTFIVGVNISISLSVDSNNDAAFHYSYSTPFTDEATNFGLFDMGASLSCQWTKLESVEELYSNTITYIGGSVGNGLYISGNLVAKGDAADPNAEAIGAQLGVGIGYGVDFHIVETTGKVIGNGEYEGVIPWFMKWLLGKY